MPSSRPFKFNERCGRWQHTQLSIIQDRFTPRLVRCVYERRGSELDQDFTIERASALRCHAVRVVRATDDVLLKAGAAARKVAERTRRILRSGETFQADTALHGIEALHDH